MQNFGAPGRNLEAIKNWAARALASSDAHYFTVAWVFMTVPNTAFVLIPYVVLAAYHVSSYANRQFAGLPLWQKYGTHMHQYLARHQTQALQINAAAEIGLGFLLIVWVRRMIAHRHFCVGFAMQLVVFAVCCSLCADEYNVAASKFRVTQLH